MTIAPPSSGTAPQGEGFETSPEHADGDGRLDGSPVPAAIRTDRLDSQINLFARAGYRVEQRAEFRAVVVKERQRAVLSRIADAARTLGAVPLLMRAPKVYHRVLIVIDPDGTARIL